MRLLLVKFDDPLAGIIGGHLLLMEREQGRDHSLNLLKDVVRNLRALVGSQHPDVEALWLACNGSVLRRSEPFQWPPLLERSWRMIINASQSQTQLVPFSLWNEVQAAIPAPPFLAWATEAKFQDTLRKDLAKAVFGSPSQVLASRAPPDTAGYRYTLPMSVPNLGRDAGATKMEAYGGRTPSVGPSSMLEAKRARELGLPPVAVTALREHLLASVNSGESPTALGRMELDDRGIEDGKPADEF